MSASSIRARKAASPQTAHFRSWEGRLNHIQVLRAVSDLSVRL